MMCRVAGLAACLAPASLRAGRSAVGTPQGVARAEGVGMEGGARIVAGEGVAYLDEAFAVLGEAAHPEAQDSIVIGSPMTADGGRVAGDGCRPRARGDHRGALAPSLADGRLLVALDSPDGAPRLWGGPRGPLPVVAAHVPGAP